MYMVVISRVYFDDPWCYDWDDHQSGDLLHQTWRYNWMLNSTIPDCGIRYCNNPRFHPVPSLQHPVVPPCSIIGRWNPNKDGE